MNEQNTVVLAALRNYILEHGYAPTLRELADAAGYQSQSSVIPRLQDLAKLGFIAYSPGIARGIALTDGG